MMATERTAFVKTDGGRKAAGFKGKVRDCVCRAIAIACELPYAEVHAALNDLVTPGDGHSSDRGIARHQYQQFLESIGWEWVPTMHIGSGCTVHLRASELPKGRIIARCSRHLVAVINGVIHDNHEPTRGGSRCVYGYFRKA